MTVTVTFKKVSVGTEINVTQEGIPDAIPAEACYLGWQESLAQLELLVEPAIPETAVDPAGQTSFTSTPRARIASIASRVGVAIGDQQVDLVDGRDHREVSPQQLRRVRDGDDPARDADHLRVELRLEHVGRHEADLRIETVDAEKQRVRLQVADRVLGRGPGQRPRAPPQHAARE